jgi:predicted HTH transcriptional regulator
LDQQKLGEYIDKLKAGKPHLAAIDEETIYELMSIKRNDEITLMAVLLFSPYPQAYFPQLCITAVVVPGTELGVEGTAGERFLDNQRIEGSIPEMLDAAIAFVRRNMRTKTIVNPETGKREDRTDYPITAVREAVLNSLVHRDYSIHTEGMPIQIIMFDDRIEIHNPGGIYGRIKVDQLGKVQPDTRNPVLATALEVLGIKVELNIICYQRLCLSSSPVSWARLVNDPRGFVSRVVVVIAVVVFVQRLAAPSTETISVDRYSFPRRYRFLEGYSFADGYSDPAGFKAERSS